MALITIISTLLMAGLFALGMWIFIIFPFVFTIRVAFIQERNIAVNCLLTFFFGYLYVLFVFLGMTDDDKKAYRVLKTKKGK